jgi:hypothetical protein
MVKTVVYIIVFSGLWQPREQLQRLLSFFVSIMLKNELRAKNNFPSTTRCCRSCRPVEICIEDISAVLRGTDLRFRLSFVSWAGMMHLILRILKF